jgi:predicted O-methyltransferase YrrM
MSAHYFDEGPPATGKKVMLAIPTYDDPSCALTFALACSREALTEAGIQSALLILQGNCHVDDGRNSIVRDFLESDCTDLMFLDSDVTWEPKDLVQLCSRDVDIVGGVYPYRREGGQNMPVRMMAEAQIVDGLMEVEGLPTGFMKIKRHVLETMAAAAPWFFDKIYPTALVFNRSQPDEHHNRWGGDLDFCRRWREMGGKLYAEAEITLGHVAKVVIWDSLGAHLRRMKGETLRHLAPKFQEGTETEDDYNELWRYASNNYAADAGTLALVTNIARKCQGPIIETGSGLSSVMMALVSSHQVYSLEHLERYALQTLDWAEEAGAENMGICHAPLTQECWYDVDKFDLPAKFAFGFCDGPPRMFGTRMRFFEEFGKRCTVIAVDDIKTDNNFAKAVYEWADANGRSVTILGRCAFLQKIEAPVLSETPLAA